MIVKTETCNIAAQKANVSSTLDSSNSAIQQNHCHWSMLL